MARDSENFSDFFYGYTHSTLLVPFFRGGGGFLRFVCLFSIQQTRPCADSISFTFPKVVVNVQVCLLSHSLAELGQLSACAHKLSANACTCHLRGTHRELVTRQKVMWVRCGECWECLWASWGDLLARPLQRFVGGPSNGVCKAVSRICISLMHSKPCLLCSQPLPILSYVTYLSILEGVRKKWASLAVSCTAGETGHSLRHSLAAVEEIPGLGGLFCH